MSRFLIVVDMQKDFVTGSLGTEEAKKILPRVAEKIKDFEGNLILTMDTHEKGYLDTLEGKNLPVKHCVIHTDGWESCDEIKAVLKGREYKIYQKDTFGSRELAQDLADLNANNKIDEIVLIGLCTDICVISNTLLMKAFLPETIIKVDASCCAGVTSKSHQNALEAMKMCQIQIVNE